MDVLPRLGLREAEAAVAAAKTMFADAGNEIGRAFGGSAEASMKTLQDEYGRTAQIAVDSSRAQATAAAQVETATASLTEVTKTYGATAAQTADAERALVDARVQATVATKAQKDAMDGAVAAHVAATTAATNHTGAIAAIAGANKVGLASTVLFTAAVAESTKAAGDFEASQTRLVTSAGESAGAIKQSSDGILKLAGDTGVSADKLSQAMYVVNSAGYTVANGGLEVLKAAAQGANNENADLGVTANAVTTALHDYHLGADQAALVTSKMITAISNGKTNMQEFSGSLHSVQPIAASLGINIDDLYGSLAAMTASGESANQATENMADALRHLSNVTKPMSDELAQVGIDGRDLMANLGKRGLAGSMQDISTAILQHMGPSGELLLSTFNQSKQAADDAKTAMAALPPQVQKIAQEFQNGQIGAVQFRKEIGAAGITADMRGLATQWLSAEQRAGGFNAMLKAGGPDVQTYTQALQKATGDAASMNVALQLTGENGDKTNAIIKKVGETTVEAGNNVKGTAEYQDTFNAKLKDANAAFHAAGIELGDVFLPALTHVAGGLKTVADYLEQHKTLASEVVIAIGAIGAAWLTAKGIMVFDTVIGGLGRMKAAIFGVRDAQLEANVALRAAAPAAAAGEAGVVAAASGEVAAEARVATAARSANLAVAGALAAVVALPHAQNWQDTNIPGAKWWDTLPLPQNLLSAASGALQGDTSRWNAITGGGAQDNAQAKLDAAVAAKGGTSPPPGGGADPLAGRAMPGRDLVWVDGKGWVTPDQAVLMPHDDLLGPNLGTGAPPAAESAKKSAQGVQVPFPAEYGAPPRPGETEQQYRDEQNLLEQHHKVAEAAAKLAAVESDSAHTTEDLTKAQNELAAARKDEYDAQLKTQDAVTKSTTQIADFGVALDKDLGLSKGLPGLADNLVRFLGNLAAAPILGPLAAISAAQGGIDKTGSGLIAMAAAQGAFGEQYTPAGQAAAGGGGGFQASGTAASGGGVADVLNATASTSGGTPTANAAGYSGGSVPANPGKQAIANMILNSALSRGYSMDQARGLLAYSIGESSLNPGISGGNQGGDEVIGLFQEKGAFSGGHDVAWRADPQNNINAYLDQFAKHQNAGDIPHQLFATSVGGPFYTGGYGAMAGLEQQAQGYINNWKPGQPPPAAGAPPAGAPTAPNPPWPNPILGKPSPWEVNPSQGFDTGDGWLQPGTTVVHNTTGAPEHLTTPQHMPWGSTPGQPVAPGPAAGIEAGKQGPSQVGGGEPKNAPGGGQSGGGLVSAATGAASMAADIVAPGSGAAVQIASQEVQRAIKFAGQATAIGIGGLLDTFIPFGGSDLAQNNWLTRGASAFAGVQPQIPNTAGKSASVDAMQKNQQTAQPMPLPQPISSGRESGPAPGPTIINNNITQNNHGKANDPGTEAIGDHLRRQYENLPGQR
jgi:TP901 family phage tail tape measure protein